ncbi:MAG: hypothetical protein R6U29_04115, partial [Desulfosudaceae bacterium]
KLVPIPQAIGMTAQKIDAGRLHGPGRIRAPLTRRVTLGAWTWTSPILLFLIGLVLFCAAACAPLPGPEERRTTTHRLAAARGWQRLDLAAPPFVLAAFLPSSLAQGGAADRILTVYLEGDGLAWLSATRRCSDPTPLTPMALLLAQADPGPAVALARPCQYGTLAAGGCDSRYWTSHRFAPEVIAATSLAVSRLKELSGAGGLRLAGYSGGAAVAALVAAERDDVRELITVAGNLDHVAWTRLHRLTPLHGSLNPLAVAPTLSRLPQRHFVGSEDTIIPERVARGFLDAQGSGACVSLQVVAGADHSRGWVERWPDLLRSSVPCGMKNAE